MLTNSRIVKKPTINIIPLVDVLTCSTFFFLVTMEFKSLYVMNITLPEIETAGKNISNNSLYIAVDADGKIYFNGSLIEKNQIVDSLKVFKGFSNQRDLLIIADENTELKIITEIMDFCRMNDFDKIRIQSR